MLLFICCNDKPNDPDPDTTRPTVVAVSPTNGTEQVALDVVISATFSEKLSPSTVTNLSFGIVGVAGIVSYIDSTASFTPTGGLDSATTYVATATTAIKDVAGNPMASNFTWSFKTVLDSSTADLVPPEAAITNPADSAVLGDTVTIRVTATDNTEVERVEFFIDDVQVVSAVDSTSPYEYLWDLSLLETGSEHTLHAIAYDTAGNSGTSATIRVYYLWRQSPVIAAPLTGAIVGDTVYINALPPTTIYSIDMAMFYVDDVHIVSADDAIPPYEFTWDASGWEIGSVHSIYVLMGDSAGNILSTDTVTVHYLWQLLVADGDEVPQARDISNVFTRSSDSALEFRIETNGSWGTDYRDTSGIDVVFFLDMDQDSLTGQTTVLNGTIPINDIGAEYRVIIGFHGDSLATWSDFGGGLWDGVHGASGFAYRNIQPDTNVFEIGIFRTQIGDPVFDIDIVTTNVQLLDSINVATWRWDWAPNSGHATFNMSTPGLFTAPMSTSGRQLRTTSNSGRVSNPFD